MLLETCNVKTAREISRLKNKSKLITAFCGHTFFPVVVFLASCCAATGSQHTARRLWQRIIHEKLLPGDGHRCSKPSLVPSGPVQLLVSAGAARRAVPAAPAAVPEDEDRGEKQLDGLCCARQHRGPGPDLHTPWPQQLLQPQNRAGDTHALVCGL